MRYFALIVSLAFSLPVHAQDITTHVDENPFRGEKPKAAPDPRAAQEERVRLAAREIEAAVRNKAMAVRPSVGYMRGGKMFQLNLEDPRQADGEEEVAPQAINGLNLNAMALAADNYDRWVLNELPSFEAWRRSMEKSLQTFVVFEGNMRQLSDAEKKKLTLAGLGDIKRLADRVEESRSEFESVRMQFRAGFKFLQELDKSDRRMMEEPFGEGSLFAKTLRKMENERVNSR